MPQFGVWFFFLIQNLHFCVLLKICFCSQGLGQPWADPAGVGRDEEGTGGSGAVLEPGQAPLSVIHPIPAGLRRWDPFILLPQRLRTSPAHRDDPDLSLPFRFPSPGGFWSSQGTSLVTATFCC